MPADTVGRFTGAGGAAVVAGTAVAALSIFFGAAAPPSGALAKCLRTNSACCTSMELECVFFSVTPISGR